MALVGHGGERAVSSMAAWQQALRQRWLALQPRERAGVRLALGLLGIYLLWLLMLPAWQTWRGAESRRQAMDTQLQRMQTLQAQAVQLKSAAQAASPRWREELAQSMASLGQAELQESGGQLRVLLKGCSPQELGAWLAALGPRWRLQVSQASLRANEQGLWQGQITLQAP